MFASIRKAGLSRSAPVSKFVIVASQMSRPSYDLPIDSRRNEIAVAPSAQRLEQLRELVVLVERVEADVRHYAPSSFSSGPVSSGS